MTACEQKKEVKKQTATSSTVMESQKKEFININHFSKIDEGMTYTEVKDLIGFEGNLLIEEGENILHKLNKFLLGRGIIQIHLLKLHFWMEKCILNHSKV